MSNKANLSNMVKKSEKLPKIRERKTSKKESTPIKFKQADRTNELDVVINAVADDIAIAEKKTLFQKALQEVVGVSDCDLASHILDTGANTIGPIVGKDGHNLNIIAQSLYDQKPEDVIEAQLIAQAASLFAHGMNCLTKAEKSEYIPNAESYTNMAVKFMRIHNETIETLNRYRRGGEQKVTVTHAVVAGQAIVNNFSGVGGLPKNQGDSPCPQ